MKQIRLDDIVCENMHQVLCDIAQASMDRVILKGGRSSTKSVVVAVAIVVGVMTYKRSALAAVKYANKIEERLVNTFREVMSYLGVESMWKLRKSPFEYVLLDENGRETSVSIKFTGCDKPENLKSFKPRLGSFRYIWFEELTNFINIREVNSLIQTFARGKGDHCVIMSYNPPMQSSNWVNKEFNSIKGDVIKEVSGGIYTEYEYEVKGEVKKIKQLVHHSTYLDVINSGHADWLGDNFIGMAEQSKAENPKYYRWAYLGDVVGTDANVFWNVHDWDHDLTKIKVSEIKRGFDWGYGGPDPCAYVEWYYDFRNRRLYALNEFYSPKMTLNTIKSEISYYNKNNFPIQADSANPMLNNQLRQIGLNVLDVKKGPDSVRAGIKWLQGLNGIYINKIKTPNLYKEFTEYEYVVTKDDVVTAELPDKFNHTIDATRYALVNEIKYL